MCGKSRYCNPPTAERGEDKTNFLPLMTLIQLIHADKPNLRNTEAAEEAEEIRKWGYQNWSKRVEPGADSPQL